MRVLGRPGIPLGLACWLAAAIIWSLAATRSGRTLAQPIPVAAATTNAYWAGYVTTEGAPYRGVEATWIVPATSCPPTGARTTNAYMWIGEGGYLEGLSDPLIQAGTASDCIDGHEQYHAFYEWYPGIYSADFPISLSPGDIVTVRVLESQPDYWTLSIDNRTRGTQSATATYFHADTGSADFIVERPTFCDSWSCGQMPLSTFGQVTFQDLTLDGVAGSRAGDVTDATSIALVQPDSGRTLAIPGKVAGAKDAASVLWRGPQ